MALSEKTIKEIADASGYEPGDDQMEKINWVYRRLEEMDDNKRKEKEKEWEEAMERYAPDDEKDGWQSKIVPPITTSIIEAELSHLVEYQSTPYLVGRTLEDDKYALAKQKVLEYTLEKGKFKLEFFKMLKSALIKGDGIGLEFIYRDVRNVQVPVKEDEKTGKIEYETQEKTFFEMPYLRYLPVEDVYLDETSTSLRGPNGARDGITVYYYQIDAFKNLFSGKRDPLGNAKYVKPGGQLEKLFNFKKSIEDNGEIVEVLEYWNKGIPYDAKWVVANGVLIEDGPIPYEHKELPYVKVSDVPDLDSIYSTGEAKLLKSIQDELTTIRRMRLDRQHLQIDKMFIVSENETSIDDNELVVRPHGFIRVNDTNSIKPLEYSDIKPSAYQEEDRLKEDAVRVTGMDDRMQSSSSTVARTATEAAILKESTLQRLRTKLFLLEIDTLVDFMRLRESNIKQYMKEPMLVRIMGEKGSQEYKDKVEAARRENLLILQDEVAYKKQYLTIPVEGEELYKDDKGAIKSKKIEGRTYFQAMPEYLDAEMDIKYKASPDLPVSKGLDAQRFVETYDRLIKNEAFDPAKLGEGLLLGAGKDPKDYAVPGAITDKVDEEVVQDMQATIDLASQENEDMMAGKDIPPTPYATKEHTEIHYAFMESPEFRNEEDLTIMDIFTNHVVGEAKARELRGEASMANARQQEQAQAGPEGVNAEMQAMMPDRVQGGGQVESVDEISM